MLLLVWHDSMDGKLRSKFQVDNANPEFFRNTPGPSFGAHVLLQTNGGRHTGR